MDFKEYLEKTGEIGFVGKVISSLAYVEGLPGAKPDEVVIFESGDLGKVTGLTEAAVEVLILSRTPIQAGTRVTRTDNVVSVPVGEELLGAVIDPLGHSLNPLKPLPLMREMRPVENIAPPIQARARITKPCETGVSLVDIMIPLGKGQRELVIGDQKTGKTLFLLRALFSQIKQGSIGIYTAIGKSQIAIRQFEEQLGRMGIADKVVIVASSGDAPAGMIFLAPYTAMTIAEYFRDHGHNVFLVMDDLTNHAKSYREIALLARRFPGRSSYPGDIFYTHARLLERAGNFLTSTGEAAITCLPVAEAVRGDMTGYIQSNLMSMTDGHILFDHELFAEGRRPAINSFLSVTRVGRQTQGRLQQQISQNLTAFLRNMERLRNFQSFGAELSEAIKDTIEREKRITQFLDQTAFDRVPSSVQALLFGFTWGDIWKAKTKSEIRFAIQKTIFLYDTKPEIAARVDNLVAACQTLEQLLIKVKDFDVILG